MLKKYGPYWVILILLLTALYYTFFTVDQTETAILLQLGEPVRKAFSPGLHIKIPYIQKVVFISTSLLNYDPTPVEMMTKDKKILSIDIYARWAVTNPFIYHNAVKTEENARIILGDIIKGVLRTSVGRSSMNEVITTKRTAIMDEVTKQSAEAAKSMGINVVDVSIKRIRLTTRNEQAVYERMISEQQQKADKLVAEGRQEALEIKSEGERKSSGLLAEAYRQAEETKGKGDAAAARIYAAAFNQAPEFFNFIRTLDLYRKTLDDRATLFLSRDDELMKFMKGSRERSSAGGGK